MLRSGAPGAKATVTGFSAPRFRSWPTLPLPSMLLWPIRINTCPTSQRSRNGKQPAGTLDAHECLHGCDSGLHRTGARLETARALENGSQSLGNSFVRNVHQWVMEGGKCGVFSDHIACTLVCNIIYCPSPKRALKPPCCIFFLTLKKMQSMGCFENVQSPHGFVL